MQILICGAGSGAHALAGIFSQKSNVNVRVFINDSNKVQRWNEHLNNHSLTVTFREEKNKDWSKLQSQPFLVTDDPAQAACNSDIIIFVLPAFLHLKYLKLLFPYIEEGCILIGMPGQNGFEFDVRYALRRKLNSCIVINFESLPWVCGNREFGKSVEIMSIKTQLVGALQGNPSNARIPKFIVELQKLLGNLPKLIISGHLLGMTLVSPNAYSHPPIIYGRWKNWDGQPLDYKPLFYHGIDEYTAELLGKLSEEILTISRQIGQEYPQIDLSEVIFVYDWDMNHYSEYIADKTNIHTVFITNGAYNGIVHPMLQMPNGTYLPNFNHRYLTEDIPFGLVVIRGIAAIAGVKTPYIDLVLSWCQNKLRKEYLIGSELIGKDIGETRCPQRYGLTTLPEILGLDW
ncbi:MAG: hypothetical protein F6K55_10070 [Moorea sp. SIO4A3]|nr:hypothetical protein [Moorena sp. SIO4A3]